MASAFQPPRANLTYLLSTTWQGAPTVSIGDPSPGRRVLVLTATAENWWYGQEGFNHGNIGDVPAQKLVNYGTGSGSVVLYQGNPSGSSAKITAGENSYGASYGVWLCDTPLVVHDVAKVAKSGESSVATVSTVAGGVVIAASLWEAWLYGPVTNRPPIYWSRIGEGHTDGSPVTLTTAANYLMLVSLSPA